MKRAQIITFLGGTALIVAAFLPWMKPVALFGEAAIGHEGIAIGWEGDGFVTGGVGVILIFVTLFYKGKPGKIYSLQTTALGLLACWVILSDFRRIAEIGPSAGILAATDIGLFLTLVGGLSVVIGGLLKVPPEAAEMSSRTNVHA
jgi:hypothetical protein